MPKHPTDHFTVSEFPAHNQTSPAPSDGATAVREDNCPTPDPASDAFSIPRSQRDLAKRPDPATPAVRGDAPDAKCFRGRFPLLRLPPSPSPDGVFGWVLPNSTPVLQFPPHLIPHAREVLQYLHRDSSTLVALIPDAAYESQVCCLYQESDIASGSATDSMLDGYDELPHDQRLLDNRHVVLARVVSFAAPSPDVDPDATAARPLQSTQFPEPSPEQPAEFDWLSQDMPIRDVRIAVHAVCRATYDMHADLGIPELDAVPPAHTSGLTLGSDGDTSPTGDLNPKPALSCSGLHPAPAAPAATTGGNPTQGNVATVSVRIDADIAQAIGLHPAGECTDCTPSASTVTTAPSSPLERSVDALIQRYNQFALAHHNPHHHETYTPCHIVPQGLVAAIAALDSIADSLLSRTDELRHQWLSIDTVDARVEFLTEFINTTNAQPAPLSKEEQIARRRPFWTPAWAAKADTPDADDPTHKNEPFKLQMYFQELPQLCDRREHPFMDAHTMRTLLDRELFGMDDAKSQIITHLLFHWYTGRHAADLKSAYCPPLCLVGPPGVGKTTFARAIAKIMDRRTTELGLPSIDGALDLTGSRMQWKCPTVGLIIKAMHRAGECDTVFVLDEIDKLRRGSGNHVMGDPTGILLQLLDPQGAANFEDELIAEPYDLSQALFIATANDEGEIYPALRDRMEIVRLPGYTDAEKITIARHHSIPPLEAALGLRPGQVILPDAALTHLVKQFAAGPGIRKMEQHLKTLYTSARAQLDRSRDRNGLRVPVHVDVTHVQQELSLTGRSAHWPDAWTDQLSGLPKEQTTRRRLLTELPQSCDVDPAPTIDLAAARQQLHESHHGLTQVKERLLDYLSLIQHRGSNELPPLCLVGPPGVGKTTFAETMAQILKRPLQRVSVGGANELPGLRGAAFAPGRILDAMLAAGRCNPIILLDEIDKVLPGPAGNAAALLEILDPAQNGAFYDQYLQLPYDLRRVLFFATANRRDDIAPELQDRLHVINLPDYTPDEKLAIARNHLVPAVLRQIGIADTQLTFTTTALSAIVELYADKVGVRDVRRGIESVALRFARRQRCGNASVAVQVTDADVTELLGTPNRNPKIL